MKQQIRKIDRGERIPTAFVHVRRGRHNQIGRPKSIQEAEDGRGRREEKQSSSLLPSTLMSIKSITFINCFLFLVQSENERKNTHTRKHEKQGNNPRESEKHSQSKRKQPNVSKN